MSDTKNESNGSKGLGVIWVIVFCGNISIGIVSIIMYFLWKYFVLPFIGDTKKFRMITPLLFGFLFIIFFISENIKFRYAFEFNKYIISHLVKVPLTQTLYWVFYFAVDNLSIVIIASMFIGSLVVLIDHLLFYDPIEEKACHDKKERNNISQPINQRAVNIALSKLKSFNENGIVFGVTTQDRKPVIMPDDNLRRGLFVLGMTGAGKTVSLRAIYERAIKSGIPLIIVDGKPDENENIPYIRNLANNSGGDFYGFNCENNINYNPFATGDYTELKDKIMSIKDDWSSDHYKTLAGSLLQTTIEILQYKKISINFENIMDYMIDIQALKSLTRGNDVLLKKIGRLENTKQEDITGLINHLETFANTKVGSYITDNNAVKLAEVINSGGVIYFALPALQYPELAPGLGKLVINDIKNTIYNCQQKVFIVFDEFSIFAGNQVLNILNQGRQFGAHTVLGTQSFADLDEISVNLRKRIIANCHNMIIHEVEEPDDRDIAAKSIGTKASLKTTYQIEGLGRYSGMGSAREVDEFIVHPRNISKLNPGEAFYYNGKSKSVAKIKVLYRN